MSEKKAPVASQGVLQDVINSIFEPGVNRGVLLVMNCAFAGLFLILFYLIYATSFNIHVCALTLIAGGLFASVQWFIIESAASKAKTPTQGSAKPQTRPASSRKKKL
ncbi:hypothetical protein IW150_001191 [Coemansia sp. RSA 2607]|nr:hypothetical protein IW150_001191 [Coemansia sp. RSA 2607]KAJ2397778.1 hypothetical protein GGI05_000461 [Coemansia sp. RSA 2603]